jgi:hypothetical protein
MKKKFVLFCFVLFCFVHEALLSNRPQLSGAYWALHAHEAARTYWNVVYILKLDPTDQSLAAESCWSPIYGAVTSTREPSRWVSSKKTALWETARNSCLFCSSRVQRSSRHSPTSGCNLPFCESYKTSRVLLCLEKFSSCCESPEVFAGRDQPEIHSLYRSVHNFELCMIGSFLLVHRLHQHSAHVVISYLITR